MGKITEAQREFLALLARYLEGAKSFTLPSVTREVDRIRQSCRRAGWAEYTGKPKRWRITPAGRAALKSQGGEHG